MKKLSLYLGVFWIALVSPLAQGQEKVFNTTFVMSGMGLNWPIFMGSQEALQKQGIEADLYVGICGGSFAAAYAAMNNADWKEDAYQIAQKVQYTHSSAFPLVPFFIKLGSWLRGGRLANFSKHSVLSGVGAAIEQSQLDVSFENLSKPLIIVATELLYNPFDLEFEEVRTRLPRTRHRHGNRYRYVRKTPKLNRGKPLYRVVFFTDSKTAKRLPRNLTPFVVNHHPQAPFAPHVQIRTDVTVAEAIRASISDPLLLRPAKIGEAYFLTGASENQPLDIFTALSEKVIDSLRGSLPTHQDDVFAAVFGFSSNKMLQNQPRPHNALLLNLDYKDELSVEQQFNPRMNKFLFWKQDRPPQAREAFFDITDQLWQFGYDRSVDRLAR